MALINFCGFETRDLVEVNTATASTVVTDPANASNYVVQVGKVTTSPAYVRLAAPAADGQTGGGTISLGTDIYYMFRVRVTTLPTATEELCNIRHTSGNYKFSLTISSAGVIGAKNAGGTVLNANIGTLATATWYRIEIRVSDSATVGNYEVRINGTSVISGTTNTSATPAGLLVCGALTNLGGSSYTILYDDMAIDTTWIGDCKVAVLTPDSNGSDVQWTATSTSWQSVDELPPDMTDFLTSLGTSGFRQGVNVISTAAAGIGASQAIKGVKAGGLFTRSATSATCTIGVRSGSTYSENATALSETASNLYIQRVVLTDPNTSLAWTTSGVDSAQVVAKATSTQSSKWGSGQLMVFYDATVLWNNKYSSMNAGCVPF